MPIKIVDAHQDLANEPRAITQKEFDDAYTRFQHRYRSGAGKPLTNDAVNIAWAEFLKLINASGIPGTKGVVIYYGISGEAMQYGFRVIEMMPIPLVAGQPDFNYVPTLEAGKGGEYPTHLLDAAGTIRPIGNLATEWIPLANDYVHTVQVDRNGTGVFQLLDALADPLKIAFPWEGEVYNLWFDNRAGLGTAKVFVQMRSIAMDHKTEAPYGCRHGIGMNMRYKKDDGDWVDLLSNKDEVLAYMNKAADIGHRCPPRCKDYTIPV